MGNIKFHEGGVTFPLGFSAAGMHCGLRKNKSKKDLALIVSDVECSAAAVYTTNKVFGAPIAVTRRNLAGGRARAAICNSGIANTCAPGGENDANAICAALAAELKIKAGEVIVASTGVIGMKLPTEIITGAIPALCAGAGKSAQSGEDAAVAIMTTDTRKKEFACSCEIGGRQVRIGAIAKGSGMIEPNMATMLCFITTDAAISPAMLQAALSEVVGDTFNMVSVDGDTSTNDMVSVMASGLAGNAVIEGQGGDCDAFKDALLALCVKIAKALAADGEGATKLVECAVTGAPTKECAKTVAKSAIKSSLVKTTIFGADANCGRILCAMGYSGAEYDPALVDVKFISPAGEIEVCKGGLVLAFDEVAAKEILLKDSIVIAINMNAGTAKATAWGCDLSYEYVRINGDYRS